MRYIYENRSDVAHVVTLVSENKSSISHIPMGPNARLELSYPGLDVYVPHWLRRVNDAGMDISASIVASRELAPAKPIEVKEPLKTEVKEMEKESKKEVKPEKKTKSTQITEE